MTGTEHWFNEEGGFTLNRTATLLLAHAEHAYVAFDTG
jgi:hypothetical protein